MLVSDDSIVLHSRKYGDTSKIVNIFTRSHGKLTVIAKGARQPKSKFGASLEPLAHSNVSLYMKPNRDLHLLSNAETVTPIRRIHSSIEHLTYGLCILEALSQTQPPNAPNEELFDFALKMLSILNKKENNPYSIFVAFQIKLTTLLGFDMDLEIESKDDPDEHGNSIAFSIENGCFARNGSFRLQELHKITPATAELLRKLSRKPAEEASDFEFPASQKKLIINLFTRYLSFHLDRNFYYKTLDFMDFA